MSEQVVTRRRPWRSALLISALGFAAVLLAACGDDAPDPAGAALSERWLRVGQDHSVHVEVLERELPSHLVDLLNPDRREDTPAEDLVAFPVHPEGELLGSYVTRQTDGEQVIWLFYDVEGHTLAEVTSTVTTQLDESPWQVTAEHGNRSFTVVRFESTQSGDIVGNTFVEVSPPHDEYQVTVLRDEAEVTLDVRRIAPAPALEATWRDTLEVTRVAPGLAREAGLQEGDRIIRVGDVEVDSPEALQQALEDMALEVSSISVIYALQFLPAQEVTIPFVTHANLVLPEAFPARTAFEGLTIDEYDTVVDAQGSYFAVSLFSADAPARMADQIRSGLEADGWTIVADDAVGLSTQLQFERTDLQLAGVAQIGEAVGDPSLAQAFVQIQTSAPAGN